MVSVDIVIPILNEEETLKNQVDKMLLHLDRDKYKDFKINIVLSDNGSTDRTPEISMNIVSLNPKKVKFTQVAEKGVGRALKKAWGESDADIVGYMDLDLATDLKHLSEAIEALVTNDYDFVYGSRLNENSKVIGRSLKREVTSRIFNKIIQFYFFSRISDGMCGFKFFKRKLYPSLLNKGAESDGWFFCTEILLAADKCNVKIYELPVIWTDNPNSKVNISKLAIEYLKAMRSLKKNFKGVE